MVAHPSGTVTFLFSDIEGSTKLAQGHPDKWEDLRSRHHAILQSTMEAHNGYVFQIIGDAFCVAFHTAGDALRAAIEVQRHLFQEVWSPAPIRVRIGINTGTAQVSDDIDISGGYKGYTAMARVQRLMSAAHGGQIVISLATEELVRDDLPKDVLLRDLGERRLKDLIRPERIHQVITPDLPADFPPLKTLDSYRHNLPIQLTSFIGREKEMADIKLFITDHQRLVTLTGIGGTGKTRLSLQASADLIDEFNDGVWFVQLAPISDATLVPQAVASAWGVRDQPGQALTEALSDYARSKNLLLILDNCEHVVEACATLVNELLHHAPKIKILATSRVSLNVDGESTYPVHPLSLPDLGQTLPLPALTQYEAVRLFIDRAVSVRLTFNVTNANAPAVAQICQRLDGIPLAIELAAARIRSLSPAQIAARLGDRFNLLTGGARTSLPRQQTLRATMDWSYELLPEHERQMLNQLSVFAGNFSLEAVETVCFGGNISILDALSALVDNSLVITDEINNETRYQLLETVRQYAFEKLEASGESQSTQDRHLDYFVKFAEEGFPHVWAGQTGWVDRFEADYANLRSAMEHSLSTNVESAIRLGKSMDMFWDLTHRGKEAYAWGLRMFEATETWQPGKYRAFVLSSVGWRTYTVAGNLSAGLELAESALEMARKFCDKPDLLYILQGLGAINWFTCNWEKMRVYAEEYLNLSLELDDRYNIHGAYWQLGAAACGSGNIELGRSYYEKALEFARRDDSPLTVTAALRELALISHRAGNYARAKELYREGLQASKDARWSGNTVGLIIHLGQIALQENQPLQAKAFFEESLESWRALKITEGNVDVLAGFSGVAGVAGQYELAAKLYGATDAAYQTKDNNFEMGDIDHMVHDPIIAAVRENLGEDIFKVAYEAGKQMSLDEAVAYALKGLGQ